MKGFDMGKMIAVSGKGGVGKTTIAGLIVRQLVAAGRTPVLAVDADPNSCLDVQLGLKIEKTVGRVREDVREEVKQGLAGISKQDLLRLKIAESLVESRGFDLVAMGRPEGPGCYCYANNVLKSVLAEISGQYPYIVLDNEAGLENLSRRIVQKVDLLVMITDPSNTGMDTVVRLHALAREMDIRYDRLVIAVNRHKGALPPRIADIIDLTGASEVLALADDPEITAFAETGKSLLDLSPDNSAVLTIGQFVRNL